MIRNDFVYIPNRFPILDLFTFFSNFLYHLVHSFPICSFYVGIILLCFIEPDAIIRTFHIFCITCRSSRLLITSSCGYHRNFVILIIYFWSGLLFLSECSIHFHALLQKLSVATSALTILFGEQLSVFSITRQILILRLVLISNIIFFSYPPFKNISS